MNQRSNIQRMFSWSVVILIGMMLVRGEARSRAVEPADDQSSPESQTFAVSKGGSLRVDLNAGKVIITTGNSTQVHVQVTTEDNDALDRLSLTQNGNSVTVRNHSVGVSEDDRYEISVPAEFTLDIRTSDGDITVGSKLLGDLSAVTSSGSVHIGDVTGTVDVKTSGGDMHVKHIDGDLTLLTSGGNINVGSVTGAADLNTSGGDIAIGKVGKALSAITSGGDVTFDDVGGETTISTSGGTIRGGTVDGKSNLRTAGGDIVLDGGKGVIKVATAGGNLDLSDIVGSLEASTAGGDITVELTPTLATRSKIKTASGRIKLYVPEDAKAEITAVLRVHGEWRLGEGVDDYHINSDFKPTENPISENQGETEFRCIYILNGGGQQISVEAVDADIDIRALNAAHAKLRKK